MGGSYWKRMNSWGAGLNFGWDSNFPFSSASASAQSGRGKLKPGETGPGAEGSEEAGLEPGALLFACSEAEAEGSRWNCLTVAEGHLANLAIFIYAAKYD